MISITKTTFVIMMIIVLIIHVNAMGFVYNTGSTFYNSKCKTNEINDVWDILHSNFNDYSEYNYTKNWYVVVFFLPLLYSYDEVSMEFINEFIIKFLIIVLLRSFTIVTTILPKNSIMEEILPDENGNLSLYEKTIGGGCYDKMFSGHFAFGLLLTLLMFKYNILDTNSLNNIVFTIVNIIHLFILSVTRSHYTMDMIVSLYVTILVYNLKISITQ
jgi:hypothetical protein